MSNPIKRKADSAAESAAAARHWRCTKQCFYERRLPCGDGFCALLPQKTAAGSLPADVRSRKTDTGYPHEECTAMMPNWLTRGQARTTQGDARQ